MNPLKILYYKKKERKILKNTIYQLKNVFNTRYDQLEEDIRNSFQSSIKNLKETRKNLFYFTSFNESYLEKSKLYVQEAQKLISNYSTPSCSPIMKEIVETLVVAFGVAMTFRTYFFQPFMIPTGSMQPTLYGRHSEYVDLDKKNVSFVDTTPLKYCKWVLTGKKFVNITSHEDGRIHIYTDNRKAPGMIIINLCGKIYQIPDDCIQRHELNMREVFATPLMADNPNASLHNLAQGYVKKNTRIWSGYVISGDQIFANRFVWHFTKPKRDDVIIFLTSLSEVVFGESSKQTFPFPFHVDQKCYSRNLVPKQNYIKRLIGLPSESISIKNNKIIADGIEVNDCFGINRVAEKQFSYKNGPQYLGYQTINQSNPGYNGDGFLFNETDSIKLNDSYLPLGDNTASSFDGRFWGPVPRRAMLARASVVWWPISRRWGNIK